MKEVRIAIEGSHHLLMVSNRCVCATVAINYINTVHTNAKV